MWCFPYVIDGGCQSPSRSDLSQQKLPFSISYGVTPAKRGPGEEI